MVIFGLNSFEVFTQSFCELSFSLAYIDLVATAQRTGKNMAIPPSQSLSIWPQH